MEHHKQVLVEQGLLIGKRQLKTGDFTAVSGEGYFVNTTSGIITLTLPASPSVGDIVAFKDYAGTFQTNNLTIDRNGSNITGGTNNAIISVEGQSVVLIYGDATQGWQAVEAATNSDLPRPNFICASVSGACNTLVTAPDCANVKIATFTGPGTFTVNSISDSCAANNVVSHLVVAGGAGGGTCGGGGGGAGGFREVKNPVTPYTASPLDGYPSAPNRVTVTATAFPITVGAAGAGAAKPAGTGSAGSNSVFSTITSAGGGGGGKFCGGPSMPAPFTGQPGGSGGGSGGIGPASIITGGPGNQPPVSPSQGNNGGTGQHIGGCAMRSGGGGGATTVGGNGTNTTPGPGSGVGGTGGTGTNNKYYRITFSLRWWRRWSRFWKSRWISSFSLWHRRHRWC